MYILASNLDLVIEHTSVVECVAVYGGGLFVFSGNSNMTLHNATIARCHSSTSGGGLFIYEDNDFLTISGSSFAGCTASVEGGGVYIDANEALRVLDTVLEDCQAGTHGGGLYFSTGSVNNLVSGCIIAGCSAGGYGRLLCGLCDGVCVCVMVGCSDDIMQYNAMPQPCLIQLTTPSVVHMYIHACK